MRRTKYCWPSKTLLIVVSTLGAVTVAQQSKADDKTTSAGLKHGLVGQVLNTGEASMKDYTAECTVEVVIKDPGSADDNKTKSHTFAKFLIQANDSDKELVWVDPQCHQENKFSFDVKSDVKSISCELTNATSKPHGHGPYKSTWPAKGDAPGTQHISLTGTSANPGFTEEVTPAGATKPVKVKWNGGKDKTQDLKGANGNIPFTLAKVSRPCTGDVDKPAAKTGD
jgi:hypothetical protein